MRENRTISCCKIGSIRTVPYEHEVIQIDKIPDRVRYPPLKDSGLVMKKFVTSAQCLVAYPRVLFTQPFPNTLEELHQFRTIGLGNTEQQRV